MPPKAGVFALWLGMMVLANWMLINSGTVKEAYILLLAMNLCGCLTLLLAIPWLEKSIKLRQAIFAQVLFILIAAPVWLTLLDDTPKLVYGLCRWRSISDSAKSAHRAVRRYLLPAVQCGRAMHFNPSANFLVLAGVLWFCFGDRELIRTGYPGGWVLPALLALAFVFGIVPTGLDSPGSLSSGTSTISITPFLVSRSSAFSFWLVSE